MVQQNKSSIKQEENVQNNNELFVIRKGGGSIIDRRPLFSPDNLTLFVTWGNTVRGFSTRTGECVRDYEGLKDATVGVALHPGNPKLLVAVSEQGDLAEWAWETQFPPRKVKLKLKRGMRATGFCLAPSADEDKDRCYVYLTIDTLQQSKRVTLVKCHATTGELLDQFPFSLGNTSHNIAVGGFESQPFVAAIEERFLDVIGVESSVIVKFAVGQGRQFTCVTGHPLEQILAAGDSSGRVLVYREFLDMVPCKPTLYHWHTLAVADIMFTRAGSYMYSAGGEAVMVKWTMGTDLKKQFLPRLPAPITHLTVAADNNAIAISTADNGIQVVNAQLKLQCAIQHFCWSSQGTSFLEYDPRTKSLVLGARIGHVQFYSTLSATLLYTVDVTGQNYLTMERTSTIINTDVTRVAVSWDGQWLATVERRDDGQTSPEVRLKFWGFTEAAQIFSLNTSVELPHGTGPVGAVVFQPGAEVNQLLAVTAGQDFKFRVWGLSEPRGPVGKETSVWLNEGIGFYKKLPTGDLSFSADGSLLAATFGPTLTCWDPNTSDLKCNLTHPRLRSNLRLVECGHDDCSHLVVVANDSSLGVWNLLTLALVWVSNVAVAALVSNPFSSTMAAFASTGQLFVFSPRSPDPLYKHDDVCMGQGQVLAAAFVPRSTPAGPYPWMARSQLYYFTSKQELLSLEGPSSHQMGSADVLPMMGLPSTTAFGTLVASKSQSGVKQTASVKHTALGQSREDFIEKFVNSPAHTMPPISKLCAAFLHSLVILTNNRLETEGAKEEAPPKPESEEEDSDSEGEAPRRPAVQPLSAKVLLLAEVDERLEKMLKQSSLVDRS